MKPILFDSNETAFTSHGIGTIADASSCVVDEQLNGKYELTIEVPVTSRHFAEIQPRRILLAKANPFDAPQPFRIYRSSKRSGKTQTFYAQHLSYDMDGIPVAPFTANAVTEACWYITNFHLINSPFQVSTDMTTTGTMEVKVPTVARALLGDQTESLLKKYGGQLRFDRYAVQLLQRRGADRGARILYGKNLIDLSQEEIISKVYTGVLPYWQNDDALVVGTIRNAPGSFPFARILPVSFNSDFTDQPTVDQLNAAADEYIQREEIGKPQVSIKASFVPPGSSGVTSLEEIYLGDSVTVRFAALGIDVKSTVTGCSYDVLRERYTSVEIGDPAPTVAKAITDAGRLNRGTLKESVIGARSVGGGKLKKGAVGETELGDGAVDTPKIRGHAVTYDLLSLAVQQLFVDVLEANQIYAGVISADKSVNCSTLIVSGTQYVRTTISYKNWAGGDSSMSVLAVPSGT